MKKFTTKAVLVACAMGCMSVQALAGNKDRSGQAGATELLINPWGASNGLFGLNTANVRGLEAMKGNIAGLALADRTEVGFAYSMYLKGSNVGVNNLGISQKLGNAGVLGVNVQSMTFGDITVTDYNNPTGGIGTYKPQFFNFQLGFAKEFSHGVQAGIAATYVTEQISNIRASGACFEAGIQYTTGKRDNFHFGVTLRNVGTNMRFSGPGFSINSDAPENSSYTLDRETPAEKFEMPTYLNIGVAYDIYLDENRLKSEDDKPKHRASIVGAFQSNSFNNDYLGLGVEYSFRDMFMLRGGYRYEKNIGDAQQSTTFYTGISAGASVQYKIGGDKGPMVAIDYAYKPTQRPANGVHTFSLRLTRR